MVKPLLVLCLLCVLSAAAHAQSPAAVPAITQAAQDSAGTIWGASDNLEGKIFRRLNNTWLPVELPEAKGSFFRTLKRGDDGAVYVLWHTQYPNSPEILISRQSGTISRVLARFPDLAPDSGWSNAAIPFWAGKEDDVWVAGKQMLWHISASGTVATFPFKAEQFRNAQPTPWNSPVTSSLVDGQGRRWFWQSGQLWMNNTMRGVLVWDGKEMSYHATLPGLPDQPISTLALLDTHHLWVALAGPYFNNSPTLPGGLYQVDTQTLNAVRETPLEKPSAQNKWLFDASMQNVAQLFQAHRVWYALDSPQYNGLPPTLWRRGKSGWQKCIVKLQKSGGYYLADRPYPWIETSSGVWLGVQGETWWIPANGGFAVPVDWRRGFAPSEILGFFRQPNERILALNTGGVLTAILPSQPPPPLLLPKGIREGSIRAGVTAVLADPHRHLWMVGMDWSRGFPLDEWDGVRWRVHIAPKSALQVQGLLAADTAGRLWMTSQTWTPPAPPVNGLTIYDPARDRWTNYAGPAEALAAAALLPGVKLLPTHSVTFSYALSGDGRAAYGDDKTIGLYDGKDWHLWKANEIAKDTDTWKYGNQSFNGYLALGGDGSFQVRLNSGNWIWRAESGWLPMAQPAYQPPPPLPPGGPPAIYEWPNYNLTLPADETGAEWVNWEGAVYKTWHGAWAKQTAISVPGSPFQDWRGIEQIFTDPCGRKFFLTNPTGYSELVPWLPPSRNSLPPPHIVVTPQALDAVTLRFDTATRLSHRTLWRVNGGEWKPLPETRVVALSDLPNGNYRVEAETLDTLLQTSPQPSLAVFSIRPASAAQIGLWIKTLLADRDDARNQAAADLVKQSDRALSALQSARSGATEIGEWWLDAVIQQIEASQTPASASAAVR